MSDKVTEKLVDYNGIRSHVIIPENPSTLAFIFSGFDMKPSDDLMQNLRRGAMERGAATVLPDMTGVKLNEADPENVFSNFKDAVNSVVEGYYADYDIYKPEQFEIIAHSAGGAGALMAAPNHNLSHLTLLDPTLAGKECPEGIDCPTNFILSSMRSYRRVGKQRHSELSQYNPNTQLILLDSDSKDRDTAHNFREFMPEVKALIRDNAPQADAQPQAQSTPTNPNDSPESSL